MTKEDNIQYWVDLSDYDMETANAATNYLLGEVPGGALCDTHDEKKD